MARKRIARKDPLPNQVWEDALMFLELAYGYERGYATRTHDKLSLAIIRSLNEQCSKLRQHEDQLGDRMLLAEFYFDLIEIYHDVIRQKKWLAKDYRRLLAHSATIQHLTGRSPSKKNREALRTDLKILAPPPNEIKWYDGIRLRGGKARGVSTAAKENLGQLAPHTKARTLQTFLGTLKGQAVRKRVRFSSYAEMDFDSFLKEAIRQIQRRPAP